MLTPLLTAALETVLNYLLYRDEALKAYRFRLVGRVLKISLQECNTPIYLSFNEQCLSVVDTWTAPVDCVVTTQLSVLAQVRDSQHITRLIRRDELNIEGDLQVIQQFIAWLELVEWEPAELLAPYTGDIVAQEVSTRLQGTITTLMRFAQQQHDTWTQAITEEWRLAPGSLEVAEFYEEIALLEQQINLLERRFTTLGEVL